MNVGLFLRPAEETWCVSTRMVAIYVSPEQTQCIDHRIWVLIPMFIHRPQHQALFLTTLLLQDLWFADLVSSWMKTISVLVSSRNLSSVFSFILKLVWHCRNNRLAIVLQLLQQSSPVFWSTIFFKDMRCMFHITIIQCKLRYDSILLFDQESHFHERSNVFMK